VKPLCTTARTIRVADIIQKENTYYSLVDSVNMNALIVFYSLRE